MADPRAHGVAALAAATALAAVLSGCTSSGSAGPVTGDNTAATELTRLAGLGAAATYSASYLFHQSSPDSTATVNVWHAPPSLRVDVVSAGTTATLLRTAKATYSCGTKARKPLCFTVARAGEKVPAPFDVGPASLFSDDLQTLSASGASYVVTAASPIPAAGGVPAATCFAVKAGVLTPAPAIQRGTYCFSGAGVLTSVTYPSGNTARMLRMSSTAPAAKFVPYASPAPLPS